MKDNDLKKRVEEFLIEYFKKHNEYPKTCKVRGYDVTVNYSTNPKFLNITTIKKGKGIAFSTKVYQKKTRIKRELVKIYSLPLTPEEYSANAKLVLKMPARYNLIDCLNDLKAGRPLAGQNSIQKWIDEIKSNPEIGKPFS